ncbi:MAG: chitobiase/beta-hexosaminidase C-terminal domain-containing protein [Paludibacteraceae bacterium]|nr:chitobiase/beta-hexosaminidase C-terminal domain-containing protein [Paludibacteraceae bacterium]
MKKLSFFLMAMFLTLCVTNAWAADSTVKFGTDWNAVFGTSYNGTFNPSKNALTLTGTIDAVTLTAKNGTSTNGYVKTGDWRLYNGYTLTIAVQEGNAISNITAKKGGKTITGITANEGNLEIPSGGASMTWTGNTNEVVFSISATMGFSEISVTYSATGSTSKETTSLTWSADAYAATIGAENTFPTLTTDPVDLEGVTYSSSNVAAATIAADGTITLVAPGTTNITASFAGNETHYAATAASYKLTVKNSLENAVPYELHTGNLVEGDYVVFYANNGMKAQVVSNRLSYTEYIPEADVIYDPSADDVWHISKNGDYWTLYNAATAKYAAGNGTKNQAALVDNVGDAALWTATMTDGTFEFVNKKNNDASVNKNLRYNAGYGFACYGTSTGGALSLYKKVVANDAVTSPIISGNAEFVESTEVTIVAEDGLKVYYTLDGTDPTNASTEYTAPFELTATTTVKAVAYYGENASEVVSKTFKKLQVLTCEEAADACTSTESADKYVIRGYVTNIASAWSDQYNNTSFWMADTKNGGKVFEAFRATPVVAADKSVKVGDYVEVIGNLVLYGTTPETVAGGTYTIIPAPVVNHTITVSANPAEAGTVTGGGEFEETDKITVEAVANEGYEFVNWTENEVEVSDDAEYTFEVLADRNLVANFKVAEPVIEWIEMELEIANLTTEVMEVGDKKYLQLNGRNDMEDADVTLFLNDYADADGDYVVNTETAYLTYGGLELTVIEGVMTQTTDVEKGAIYTGTVRASVTDEEEGGTMYLEFALTMYSAPATVLVLTDAIVAINEELGTLTFNVATEEGGYYAELAGYTGPGVHEGPQICLLETPEAVAFANYVETSVVDGVITLTGEFTSFMGAKFDLTISGKLPVVEPEVIEYVLNGGEFPAVVVPTNAELWEAFKPYYNTYYGLNRADQAIDKVSTFASAYMQKIMTDEASEYKWLGDYVLSVATAAGVTLSTDMAAANESGWRWAVHAFFNANAGQYGATGIDFTEAGKPEVWGAAYEAEYGVVLPTEPVTEDYVLPTPVKEGYTFVGWYDNAEGIGEAYTVIPAGWAGTLYAIWKQSPATALENIAVEGKAVKAIINGQLVIIKNGVQYNAQGQVVK